MEDPYSFTTAKSGQGSQVSLGALKDFGVKHEVIPEFEESKMVGLHGQQSHRPVDTIKESL